MYAKKLITTPKRRRVSKIESVPEPTKKFAWVDRQKLIMLASLFVAIITTVLITTVAIKSDDKEQSLAETETNEARILGEVSNLLTLPDEEPIIATVTNPEKLHDQPFFAKAETGDKVLYYDRAKKVILYRPDEHKIIQVALLSDSKRSP